LNFLIACGGTAGHINPAIAIAEEIRARLPKSKILFVGAGKPLENRLIPAAGFHLVNIRMSGLRRSVSLEDLLYNAGTVRNLVTAGVKAEKLLVRFSPAVVIGTGGYICYPILKKAAQIGIPTIIHGSDAVPGLTTKLLSTAVDKVLVSFPGLEHLYRRPERVVFTGTPVREGFEAAAMLSEKSGKDADQNKLPKLLSFWGSQGAERMNESISEMIACNIKNIRFDHLHATGKSESSVMKTRLERLGITDKLPQGIQVREYIDDMPSVMADADLVLCRAGASTIAELTVLGKPAILVPSPYVTNNHQEANAKQLQKSGGAEVISEKDSSGERLYNEVSALITDKEKLLRMSYAQKSLATPKATQRIVDIVFEMAGLS